MKVHRKVRLYEKKLILLIFSLFVLLICSESYFYIMSKKYPEIKISQEQFYGKQNENLKDFKVEDGKITDGAFAGSGCAVSQASADMMLDLIIGRTKEEALELSDIFLKMIHDEATPEEIDRLEEASSLQDISHMPARVKCAVLGWHTMEEMLNDK